MQLKLFFVIVIFGLQSFATQTVTPQSQLRLQPQFFQAVREAHDMGPRLKKMASQTKVQRGLILDYNRLDKTDLKKIEIIDAKIEKEINEKYDQEFMKAFSKLEIDYLQQLYQNNLMKKLVQFNTDFLKSQEVKQITESNVEILKLGLASSKANMQETSNALSGAVSAPSGLK